MADAVKNPFWGEVLQNFIDEMHRVAARTTQRAVDQYNRHYANVKRSWDEQSKKMTMLEVPKAAVFNEQTFQLEYVDIPGYPKPAPWDNEPGEQELGFGPHIEGTDPKAYWVTGSKGEKTGIIKQKDGKDYSLLILGRRGSFTFVRMWLPV